MADRIGKAQRIDFLAAVQDDLGEPRPAHEHAEHRTPVLAIGQRDQLAHHDMAFQVVARDLDDPVERRQRLAACTEVERDQVGLAVGQHRDRGRRLAEMAAMIELGQRRLHRAVTAVDHEHARLDQRDGAQRVSNLVDLFDLVMEDVRVARAIIAHRRQHCLVAGRARIGNERNESHSGHPIGLIVIPWR